MEKETFSDAINVNKDKFILVLSKDDSLLAALENSLGGLYRLKTAKDIESANLIIETGLPILVILDISSCREEIKYADCKDFLTQLNKRYIIIYLVISEAQKDDKQIKTLLPKIDVVVTKPLDFTYLGEKIDGSVRFRKLEEEIIAQDKILYLLNEEVNFEKTDITKSEIKKYALDLIKQFREFAQNALLKEKEKAKELKFSQEELRKANRELKKTLDDLQKTQLQLVQSEKLAAIGQLAAGVAHELNSPLGGIIGFSQFMQEKLDKKDARITKEGMERYKTNLKKIEIAAIQCKTIIQNLLNFARTSQKEPLLEDIEPLEINQLLDETLLLLEHQLAMNNIKIIKKFPKDIGKAAGISSQLQQVFTNIILNAQDAMLPEGGTLSICVQQHSPDKISIDFTDTGSGIKKEDINKIFDPFFTTKSPGKGTGLGLSVSYSIIKNLSGEILVKSSPGKGSAFSIILPAVKS